jgi:hypothetical protein
MPWKKSSRTFLFAVAMVTLAQNKDPLIGTWELDRGKSEFQPDSPMQSRTLVVESKGGALSISQKTVAQDGHASFVDFTAGYDGKDAPISGSVLDTVALKRISGATERTGKIHGQTTETAIISVSSDGKILTIKTKGSANGLEYMSTQIFARQ